MSRVLEDRVLAAHPLAPAYRMVLFMIARDIADGQTEILLNRAALARRLDASADVVRHAIIAGEQVGVCRLLRTKGRVAFDAYDGVIGAAPPAATPEPPVVRAVSGPSADVTTHMSLKGFMEAFKRAWEAKYRQQYVFREGIDHKLAKRLAAQIPAADVPRYITNYLKHPDPFYRSCAHSFAQFYDKINTFGARAAAEPSRVMDVAQTREYLSDLNKTGGPHGGGPHRT